MATHTITLGVDCSGFSRSKEISNTDNGVSLIDGETVITGAADQDLQIAFVLDVSECSSFYLVSDQNIQLETNAVDATGGNTLNLIANEPYIWHTSSYDTFKLTADVTTTYWTNQSGSTATIYCVALYDVTP
jgi:hypothetical protein